MRWPLRLQILVPMTIAIICSLAAVTVFNAYQGVDRATRRIEQQLRDAAHILATTDFPLTPRVLEQVSGLTGAEFILMSENGDRYAASREFVDEVTDLNGTVGTWREVSLGGTIDLDSRRYFHSVMSLEGRSRREPHLRLHILYPHSSYQTAWREAVVPPLIVGGIAFAVVTLLATAIAARVSRRTKQLQRQVERIASGDFHAMQLPSGNDEVSDLAQSVNGMAEMLARYEENIRRNEQSRTLGQLAGGIAHQLRNSVTGCRLALQLHREAESSSGDAESLQVALTQLELMEKYIQRFLSRRTFSHESVEKVSLAQVVVSVLPLVQANATHVGVSLHWHPPEAAPTVSANAEALEQVVTNLILNAIEAASNATTAGCVGQVEISVTCTVENGARLEVTDTGAGPSSLVSDRMFEPLVTDKYDGTGLGLAVAREIVQAFGAKIDWERRDGRTTFFVIFEQARMEPTRAEPASH